MRQLLTWRFFAAMGALLVMAVGIDAVFGNGEQTGSIAFAGPVDLDENGDVIVRRIDLVAGVDRFERSDDFAVGQDGLTVGLMDAVLTETRVMRIAPGTPGSVDCPDLDSSNCVVLADLLGEAVVWFAVLPRGPRDTVEMPPIVDLTEGYALFGNGWQVRYPPVINRDCEGQDIPSFSDFLRRFGPNSTSYIDLETQLVSEVKCGEEFVAPATTVVFDGSLDAAIVTRPTTTVPGLDADGADPGAIDPDVVNPDVVNPDVVDADDSDPELDVPGG